MHHGHTARLCMANRINISQAESSACDAGLHNSFNFPIANTLVSWYDVHPCADSDPSSGDISRTHSLQHFDQFDQEKVMYTQGIIRQGPD